MAKLQLESLRGGTYAFVDVETSGTSANANEIIEIGIVRVEDGKITDSFQTLVRPERPVNEWITRITGLDNRSLEKAQAFPHHAERISGLLSGSVFVAHNARFDYAFVKNEFARMGMRFGAKTLCTVKLSRALFPEQQGHNLDAVIAAHNITCENRHRAYDDAEALVQFLHSAEKKMGAETVGAAIARALKRPSLPSQLDPDSLKELPRAPGVYFFYGVDDELLYVGKSVNIKTRVLSHFTNDGASSKELHMCAATRRVDFTQTTGELSALFLESKLIKELRPTHNRALRSVKQLAVIFGEKDDQGYFRARVEYIAEIDTEKLGSVLSVCRSKSQAKAFLKKLQGEHELCGVLLGLEKGSACFSFQLEKCKGACCQREAAEEYNDRFSNAFEKFRIRSWPFKGPIVIHDDSEDSGVSYVVDNWCLTKRVSYAGESSSSEDIDSFFDLDSYRILARFLLDPKKSRGKVSLLSEEGEFRYQEEAIIS